MASSESANRYYLMVLCAIGAPEVLSGTTSDDHFLTHFAPRTLSPSRRLDFVVLGGPRYAKMMASSSILRTIDSHYTALWKMTPSFLQHAEAVESVRLSDWDLFPQLYFISRACTPVLTSLGQPRCHIPLRIPYQHPLARRLKFNLRF